MSATPETDALMHSGKAHYLALALARKLERERDESRAINAELLPEVAAWKERFVTFAVIHIANYGRDHYGDQRRLHFTHYDLLASAGARMDDFERCGDPSEAEGRLS